MISSEVAGSEVVIMYPNKYIYIYIYLDTIDWHSIPKSPALTQRLHFLHHIVRHQGLRQRQGPVEVSTVCRHHHDRHGRHGAGFLGAERWYHWAEAAAVQQRPKHLLHTSLMRKNGSIITTTVPLVKIVIIIDNIYLGDAIKNCDYSRIAQVYRQYCLGVDGDHDDDDDDDDGWQLLFSLDKKCVYIYIYISLSLSNWDYSYWSRRSSPWLPAATRATRAMRWRSWRCCNSRSKS